MGRFDKQGMRALLAAVPRACPATVHSMEPAMGEEAAPEALLRTGLTTGLRDYQSKSKLYTNKNNSVNILIFYESQKVFLHCIFLLYRPSSLLLGTVSQFKVKCKGRRHVAPCFVLDKLPFRRFHILCSSIDVCHLLCIGEPNCPITDRLQLGPRMAFGSITHQ